MDFVYKYYTIDTTYTKYIYYMLCIYAMNELDKMLGEIRKERHKGQVGFEDEERGFTPKEKEMMNEEFDECMGHLALKPDGEKILYDAKLTLRELKILESGLKSYRQKCQEYFENEREDFWQEDYKREQQEIDKILQKLRLLQIHTFKQLTLDDLIYMERNKILGVVTWTAGGA